MTKGLIKQLDEHADNKLVDLSPKEQDQFVGNMYNKTAGEWLRQNKPGDAYKMGFGDPEQVEGVGVIVSALKDPILVNSFYQAINETAHHIMSLDKFSHPLERFKQRYSPLGGRVVKTTMRPAKAHQFDPIKNDSAFKRDEPEIIQEIHVHRWSKFFETTLQDTFSKQIFNNWTQFDEFVAMQMLTLKNGAVSAEYKELKKPLSLAVYSGNAVVKPLAVDPELGVSPEEVQKKLKTDIAIMSQQPTGAYNVYGIERQPTRENLTAILATETAIDIDFDLMSNAYNLGFLDPKTNIVTIDKFADLWFYSDDHTVTQEDIDGGYLDGDVYKVGDTIKKGTMAEDGAPGAKMEFDGSKVKGAVISNDALVFEDQLLDNGAPIIVDIVNPRSRSTNVYLHVEQIQSYSAVENAVFYVEEDKENPDLFTPINDVAGNGQNYVANYNVQLEMTETTITANKLEADNQSEEVEEAEGAEETPKNKKTKKSEK